MRHITNLEENVSHPKSRLYLDLLTTDVGVGNSSVELDTEAQNLLSALRDKIPLCLTDERNLEYFELEWNVDAGNNPSDDNKYISQFSHDVFFPLDSFRY
jgi:hypothetical protein